MADREGLIGYAGGGAVRRGATALGLGAAGAAAVPEDSEAAIIPRQAFVELAKREQQSGFRGFLSERLAEARQRGHRAARLRADNPGITNRDLFDETGWFRNIDGDLAFELPQRMSPYAPALDLPSSFPSNTRLSRLLDDPDLFRLYPGLEKTKVEMEDWRQGNSGWQGRYHAPKPNSPRSVGTIQLAPSSQALQTRGVLEHEIQHGIRQLGGSPDYLLGSSPSRGNGWDDYFQNLGEIEARMAQRGVTHPDESYPIARMMAEFPETHNIWEAPTPIEDFRLVDVLPNEPASRILDTFGNYAGGGVIRRGVSAFERRLNPSIQDQQLFLQHSTYPFPLEQVLNNHGGIMTGSSWAVTDVPNGTVRGFGPMSLIGRPSMLEMPGARNFAADAYTPRFPDLPMLDPDTYLDHLDPTPENILRVMDQKPMRMGEGYLNALNGGLNPFRAQVVPELRTIREIQNERGRVRRGDLQLGVQDRAEDVQRDLWERWSELLDDQLSSGESAWRNPHPLQATPEANRLFGGNNNPGDELAQLHPYAPSRLIGDTVRHGRYVANEMLVPYMESKQMRPINVRDPDQVSGFLYGANFGDNSSVENIRGYMDGLGLQNSHLYDNRTSGRTGPNAAEVLETNFQDDFLANGGIVGNYAGGGRVRDSLRAIRNHPLMDRFNEYLQKRPIGIEAPREHSERILRSGQFLRQGESDTYGYGQVDQTQPVYGALRSINPDEDLTNYNSLYDWETGSVPPSTPGLRPWEVGYGRNVFIMSPETKNRSTWTIDDTESIRTHGRHHAHTPDRKYRFQFGETPPVNTFNDVTRYFDDLRRDNESEAIRNATQFLRPISPLPIEETLEDIIRRMDADRELPLNRIGNTQYIETRTQVPIGLSDVRHLISPNRRLREMAQTDFNIGASSPTEFRRNLDLQDELGMRASGGIVGNYAGGGAVRGFRSYHGSPHKFDRFDPSKLHTGDGTSSYGRGLYFTGREPTAHYYRDPGRFNSWRGGHVYDVDLMTPPERLLSLDSTIGNQSQEIRDAIEGLSSENKRVAPFLARNWDGKHPMDRYLGLERALRLDESSAREHMLSSGIYGTRHRGNLMTSTQRKNTPYVPFDPQGDDFSIFNPEDIEMVRRRDYGDGRRNLIGETSFDRDVYYSPDEEGGIGNYAGGGVIRRGVSAFERRANPSVDDVPLFLQHSMSPENLGRTMDEMNRRIVGSSWGITDVEDGPIRGYGDVHLIGRPENMLNRPDTHTFAADAYTPTFPDVEHVRSNRNLSEIEARIAEDWQKSSWIRDQQFPDQTPFGSSDFHQSTLLDREPFDERLLAMFLLDQTNGPRLDRVRRALESQNSYDKLTEALHSSGYNYEDLSYWQSRNPRYALPQDRVIRSPDDYDTLLPANEENILNWMESQGIRGGQKVFNGEMHPFRAQVVPQLHNLAEVQAARPRVLRGPITHAQDDEFSEHHERLRREWSQAVGDFNVMAPFKGDGDFFRRSSPEIVNDLRSEYPRAPENLLHNTARHANQLAHDSLAPYMEAKMMRGISLDDRDQISGAIAGANFGRNEEVQTVRDLMERAGIDGGQLYDKRRQGRTGPTATELLEQNFSDDFLANGGLVGGYAGGGSITSPLIERRFADGGQVDRPRSGGGDVHDPGVLAHAVSDMFQRAERRPEGMDPVNQGMWRHDDDYPINENLARQGMRIRNGARREPAPWPIARGIYDFLRPHDGGELVGGAMMGAAVAKSLPLPPLARLGLAAAGWLAQTPGEGNAPGLPPRRSDGGLVRKYADGGMTEGFSPQTTPLQPSSNGISNPGVLEAIQVWNSV